MRGQYSAVPCVERPGSWRVRPTGSPASPSDFFADAIALPDLPPAQPDPLSPPAWAEKRSGAVDLSASAAATGRILIRPADAERRPVLPAIAGMRNPRGGRVRAPYSSRLRFIVTSWISGSGTYPRRPIGIARRRAAPDAVDLDPGNPSTVGVRRVDDQRGDARNAADRRSSPSTASCCQRSCRRPSRAVKAASGPGKSDVGVRRIDQDLPPRRCEFIGDRGRAKLFPPLPFL